MKTGNGITRVLALSAFPVEAAATRFRLAQFVEPLRERDIELEISPFLNSDQFKLLYHSGNLFSKAAGVAASVIRRLTEMVSMRDYDAVLVQREAMIFGPGIFEWIYYRLGRLPLVLDLDDATYVRYISPTYGRLGSALKFFGKTDGLIRRSDVVICGNRYIADHVAAEGGRPEIVPTVVDQELFAPAKPDPSRVPTVGWIGTHSTFPFLAKILPVLDDLSTAFDFKLKIVGAGDGTLRLKNCQTEFVDWDLAREAEDFRALDIGLYPIFPEGAANEEWIKGKSGFKAVQYMACGVPFVMSPVGICSEIGEAGVTHFNAETEGDWYNALSELLSDSELRSRMGRSGRQYSLSNFGLIDQADKIAEILATVARR